MKKIIFLIVLIPQAFYILAQKPLPVFGKPDRTELELKEYAPDKNANAVKLADYQETELTVEYGVIRMETERRVRIKIFNDKGFDQGSITIPYINRKKTKIKDISGYVYYLDSSGKLITEKIEKKQIFKDRSEDGVSRIAFAFPNLKPGCVVEYRYTKTEKNYIHLDPWFFQDRIPTQLSVCKIIYPAGVHIQHHAVSAKNVIEERRVKFESASNSIIESFTLEDLPAFKIEPMMTSVKDNLNRLEFNITPSFGLFNFSFLGKDQWEILTLALDAAPFFGKQFNLPIPGTEAILDSAKKLVNAGDKINYIFQEIKKTIRWNEEQSFYSGDVDEAWRNRTGNSAEINLTILNLLRKAGITAYPLLVSTRENGKPDEKFLSLGQFNGVDVLTMDSSSLFILDGTRQYQSYKVPPFNILNRDAFLVDTAMGKWVNISDQRFLLKNNLVIEATLDETGTIRGKANIAYYDLSKTQILTEKPEDNDDKDFVQKEFTDLKIDSLKEQNKEDELKPLIHDFQFSYHLSQTDNFYFLDPFFLSSFRKNPFLDSVRYTDIDFGSNQDFNVTLILQLPQKFSVNYLPKNTLLRTADTAIMFRVMYEANNGKLIFRNNFQLQRPVYDKEEYSAVKEFFERIYSMINERIIFKKT
ncbi:MAG: DUF3857 domain-containing protein [Flavisolibacter sp.]